MKNYIISDKYLPEINSYNQKRIFAIYKSIIKRCHFEKQQIIQPSYIGCILFEDWYNFQNFYDWYNKNYIDEFHLDKDILIKGNKIYGPDTCCFVPKQINNLFVKPIKRRELPLGVHKSGNKFYVCFNKNNKTITFSGFFSIEEAFKKYKIEKEKHIKELAEIWKDKISEKVYQALINYQVEITD